MSQLGIVLNWAFVPCRRALANKLGKPGVRGWVMDKVGLRERQQCSMCGVWRTAGRVDWLPPTSLWFLFLCVCGGRLLSYTTSGLVAEMVASTESRGWRGIEEDLSYCLEVHILSRGLLWGFLEQSESESNQKEKLAVPCSRDL